jgi:mRNA interferase HigB
MAMNVISRRKIVEFIADYPDSRGSLEHWYKETKKATWQNIHEVREIFPHADPVGECVVFNVAGKKYRLISKINYAEPAVPFWGRVKIRTILTHNDYSKGAWKPDCGC